MFDPTTSHLPLMTRWSARPVWPLPSLAGRDPVAIPRSPKFPGVDLAYARDDEHLMPDGVPALAVTDGAITYAGKQSFGHSLVIDHGNGWATYYANLEHMLAAPTAGRRGPRERVKAGDALGYVGAALQGEMKCLHFELWRRFDAHHFEPTDDALAQMRDWRRIDLSSDTIETARSAA